MLVILVRTCITVWSHPPGFADGGKDLDYIVVIVLVNGHVGASVVGVDPLGSTVNSAWAFPLPRL